MPHTVLQSINLLQPTLKFNTKLYKQHLRKTTGSYRKNLKNKKLICQAKKTCTIDNAHLFNLIYMENYFI